MARCRTEFIFGNLIDRGETDVKSEKLKSIKTEFIKFGIQLPLLQDSDLTIAGAFLECVKRWTGNGPEVKLNNDWGRKESPVEDNDEVFKLESDEKSAENVENKVENESNKLRRVKSLNNLLETGGGINGIRKAKSMENINVDTIDVAFFAQYRKSKESEKTDKDEIEIEKVDTVESEKSVEISDPVPICKVPPVSRTAKPIETPPVSKPAADSAATAEKGPKPMNFSNSEIMYPINPEPKMPTIPPTLERNLKRQYANQIQLGPIGGPIRRGPPTGNVHPFQISQNIQNNNNFDQKQSSRIQQSSRIRLTIQALEALIQEPGRFHRIDFGDGKGHFFKKATTQDKILYPKGEFFTARVHNDEHYFISLVVEHGMDCGLDYLCCRRDCPIHIRVQFQIEHCITSTHPFKNRFDYRITRIWQDAAASMKLYLPKELTITSQDVENFNNFVQKHLNLTSDEECYRTIHGRPVPLIIIHALISLRSNMHEKPVPVEDWREVIIELEILPRWPVCNNATERINYVEHNLDGVIMKYSRLDYLAAMNSSVHQVEKFYEKFRSLLRNITVNSNVNAAPPPPSVPTIPPPMKRARFPT